MFETASAQPLGLFQSPVLRSLERLLAGLGGRIGNFENPFVSRQQRFLDRVFSRHFEAIGLPVARSPRMPRSVEPVAMSMPASWVPSTREPQTARASDSSKPAIPAPSTRLSPRPAAPAPLAVPPSPMPMPMPMPIPARLRFRLRRQEDPP